MIQLANPIDDDHKSTFKKILFEKKTGVMYCVPQLKILKFHYYMLISKYKVTKRKGNVVAHSQKLSEANQSLVWLDVQLFHPKNIIQ